MARLHHTRQFLSRRGPSTFAPSARVDVRPLPRRFIAIIAAHRDFKERSVTY